MLSGGTWRHPCLAAEQLGEDVECSDPVLACGGEVGADGGEGSRAIVTLEVVEWARPGCSRWCERSSEVKVILIQLGAQPRQPSSQKRRVDVNSYTGYPAGHGRAGPMKVAGKVAVVTGGAGGIGAALAHRLADVGARVVVADIDGDGAKIVAERIGAERAAATGADVSSVDDIRRVLTLAQERFGPVDMYFANAGIAGEAGLGDSDEEWERTIDVNVLAHVRAARLLVPQWLERGSGYFVATASAAGLLTQIGAAPYSVTKHAAVAFAEWLSVTFGDRGIGVSCLCPMGVNTDMLNSGLHADDNATQLSARVVAHAGEVLDPEQVADDVLDAVEGERFLILPHPEVLDFFRHKGSDYERWLRGMRRLQADMA